MGETTTGIRSALSLPRIYSLWSDAVGAQRSRTTLVQEYVRPQPGDRVLDLGCGPAELLPYLGDVTYVGIDHSEAYIANAAERYPGQGEYIAGDATNFDVGSDFDLVIVFGVLHHIDADGCRGLFASAARALKPDGRCVTVDPVFTPEQSRAARAVISRDRGEHVLDPDGYAALARDAFPHVEAHVRGDLLRIPFTHCILECTGHATSG